MTKDKTVRPCFDTVLTTVVPAVVDGVGVGVGKVIVMVKLGYPAVDTSVVTGTRDVVVEVKLGNSCPTSQRPTSARLKLRGSSSANKL